MSSNHRQTLSQMSEICEYTGLSEGVVRLLIKNFKFPARKTGSDKGVWISNTYAIDEWSLGFSRSGPLVNHFDDQSEEF